MLCKVILADMISSSYWETQTLRDTSSTHLYRKRKPRKYFYLDKKWWLRHLQYNASFTEANPLTFKYDEAHFIVRVNPNSFNATPVSPCISHFQVWYCNNKRVPFIFNRILPILVSNIAFYQDVCIIACSLAEIFNIGRGIGMRACYFDGFPHSSCFWHGFSLNKP